MNTKQKKRWTESELALLRERWTENTREELAEMLNRSSVAVVQMACKLNLHEGKRSNAIPREIIDYVERHAGKVPVRELAQETGKSVNQIYSLAFNHGLDVRTRGKL